MVIGSYCKNLNNGSVDESLCVEPGDNSQSLLGCLWIMCLFWRSCLLRKVILGSLESCLPYTNHDLLKRELVYSLASSLSPGGAICSPSSSNSFTPVRLTNLIHFRAWAKEWIIFECIYLMLLSLQQGTIINYSKTKKANPQPLSFTFSKTHKPHQHKIN